MSITDILIAMNDPELDEQGKTLVMLKIIYPGWKKIPPEHLEEAAKKACEFIDCGQADDGIHRPRLIDWEQDWNLIIPAVNRVAGKEVRAYPSIHWWTFYSWFMEIGESTLSTIIHIRSKKAKGQKLDKWESDFCKENPKLVNLETKYSQEEEDFFAEWFGN